MPLHRVRAAALDSLAASVPHGTRTGLPPPSPAAKHGASRCLPVLQHAVLKELLPVGGCTLKAAAEVVELVAEKLGKPAKVASGPARACSGARASRAAARTS